MQQIRPQPSAAKRRDMRYRSAAFSTQGTPTGFLSSSFDIIAGDGMFEAQLTMLKNIPEGRSPTSSSISRFFPRTRWHKSIKVGTPESSAVLSERVLGGSGRSTVLPSVFCAASGEFIPSTATADHFATSIAQSFRASEPFGSTFLHELTTFPIFVFWINNVSEQGIPYTISILHGVMISQLEVWRAGQGSRAEPSSSASADVGLSTTPPMFFKN